MPELPEVECLTRAVRRILKGGRIVGAEFHRPDLRDEIPIEAIRSVLVGEVVEDVLRRSKYLLVKTRRGYGIFHLGMTGALLHQPQRAPTLKHTHVVFEMRDAEGGVGFLHFVDPRRFGRIACLEGEELAAHPFFASLGPEPLERGPLGRHLYEKSRGRAVPVKNFIMDPRIVVGVGNIYASESLHRAGIAPQRAAGDLSRPHYDELARAIKATLRAAIAAGGTTFRDFKDPSGKPGYFAVRLQVYDRSGEPCGRCGGSIRQLRQGGRSTFYCADCQS